MIKFKLDKEEYGYRPTVIKFSGEFIIRKVDCMQLLYDIANNDYKKEDLLCQGNCKELECPFVTGKDHEQYKCLFGRSKESIGNFLYFSNMFKMLHHKDYYNREEYDEQD